MHHDKLGIRINDKDRATPGYTLFSPLGQKNTYLIDMKGEVAHQWDNPSGPGNYAHMLPNGNLMSAFFMPDGPKGLAAKGGHIVERDWDGNIVWEHTDILQHHDFRRRANGNTAYLGWERYDDATAARVQGGIPGSEREDGLWGDTIVEIDADGNKVWDWLSSRDQEIEKYPMIPGCKRHEFCHANSLFVLDNGDMLVNWRSNYLMAIIDRETKKFKWEMVDPQFGEQHDVQMLDNGNILFFANGGETLTAGPHVGSRIIELNPQTKEIVWQYKAKPAYTFFSWFLSGCQRLASGNTLICQGVWGRFFEVTPDGEIVWDYVSPYFTPDGAHPAYENGNFVFRCYRYAADGPEIAGRLPADPG